MGLDEIGHRVSSWDQMETFLTRRNIGWDNLRRPDWVAITEGVSVDKFMTLGQGPEEVVREMISKFLLPIIGMIDLSEIRSMIDPRYIMNEGHATVFSRLLTLSENRRDLRRILNFHGVEKGLDNPLFVLEAHLRLVSKNRRGVTILEAIFSLREDMIPAFAKASPENREAFIQAQRLDAVKLCLELLNPLPERELLKIFDRLLYRYIE